MPRPGGSKVHRATADSDGSGFRPVRVGGNGASAPDEGLPPQPELTVVRRRRDFISASRARRHGTGSLLLQARHRRDGTAAIRFGLTCSRKIGNAVVRNRSRRRLREAARIVLRTAGLSGWDYILIGKPGVTAVCRFDRLVSDLRHAVTRVHRPDPRSGPRR